MSGEAEMNPVLQGALPWPCPLPASPRNFLSHMPWRQSTLLNSSTFISEMGMMSISQPPEDSEARCLKSLKHMGKLVKLLAKPESYAVLLVKTSSNVEKGIGFQRLWESLEANHLQQELMGPICLISNQRAE